MKESICQRPGADDYCRLPIFVASESEMVSGRDAFRLATLKRQPQSGKKRGNRAQAIQAVANALRVLFRKTPSHVIFSVGFADDVNSFFLFLQRPYDIFKLLRAIR
jgi:hypothetical protein